MPGRPSITDYITPAPPFMAGTNVLDKAISDIWAKRHQDEAERVAAAAQEATASFQQGSLGVSMLNAGESTRHNRATEANAMGLLQRDLSKQQLEYLDKVATAYNSGNPEIGEALGTLAGRFGLPPQVMAAVVADAQRGASPGADAGAVANEATQGPEPGSYIGPSQPSAESAIPGAQRGPPVFTQADADQSNRERGLAPPVNTAASPPGTVPLPDASPEVTAQGPAAPVSPQAAAPMPAQADMNTPKPPPPQQSQGDPTAPPATPPMPPPQAAAGGQVRREDIHNQPKPPSQLGVEAPPAPGTPAELPAMPYAGNPKQNPIAREADPNWEGRVPTQFPPGASPQVPGAGPGGVPGVVDDATQRRWAARGHLPNGQQIMANNSQRVHDALEATLLGSARGETEQQFARSAIAAGAAAASVESPEKAYDDAVKRYQNDVMQYRKDLRATEAAGASKGKFDAREDRQRTNDFIAQQTRMLNQAEFKTTRERYGNLKEMQTIIDDPSVLSLGPNAHIWQDKLQNFLKFVGNVGVTSDKDIGRSTGETGASWATRIIATIQRGLHGGGGELEKSMDEAVRVLGPILRKRGRQDYVTFRHRLDAAPSENARRQAQANLDTEYEKFDLSNYPKEESEAKPAPSASRKPKTPPRAEAPPSPPLKPKTPDVSDLGVTH